MRLISWIHPRGSGTGSRGVVNFRDRSRKAELGSWNRGKGKNKQRRRNKEGRVTTVNIREGRGEL
jgi:hypothetical protein